MISYNDVDKAWQQRVHKEIWTKDELKDFGSYCNGDSIRQKFGINKPENQEEIDMQTRNKFDRLKQQKRIRAVKMGQTYDELSQKNSVWSEVPPSPRACNEKLIWQSNLHAKNQVTRGQNCAVGRLGQYIVGDPDNKQRLDDKMKSVTARATPVARTSFDLTSSLKRPKRKPTALQPLSPDVSNLDVAYGKKNQNFGSLAKNENIFVSRHGSQVVNRTMNAVMPQSGATQTGIAHQRMTASTTRSQASKNSLHYHPKRTLQIKGHKNSINQKARFNEDVDEETKSIRQEVHNASQKLKMNLLHNRNRNSNQLDGTSNATGLQSLRSGVSRSQISGLMAPRVKDHLSQKSSGQVSQSRFAAARTSQKRANQIRMSQTLQEKLADPVVTKDAEVEPADPKFEENPNEPKSEVLPNEENLPAEGQQEGEDDGRFLDEQLAGILNSDHEAVKFDLDSESAVTFNTNTSSFMRNPSTVKTVASSKLELQLNFLAKQLELERQRRERLQNTVETMAKKLNEIQTDGPEELARNETRRQIREQNVKRPNMDVEDLKVLNGGFVSIQ